MNAPRPLHHYFQKVIMVIGKHLNIDECKPLSVTVVSIVSISLTYWYVCTIYCSDTLWKSCGVLKSFVSDFPLPLKSTMAFDILQIISDTKPRDIYQKHLLSYDSGLRHWCNTRKKQFDSLLILVFLICVTCFSKWGLIILTSFSKFVLDIRKFSNQSKSMTSLFRILSHQALVHPFFPQHVLRPRIFFLFKRIFLFTWKEDLANSNLIRFLESCWFPCQKRIFEKKIDFQSRT